MGGQEQCGCARWTLDPSGHALAPDATAVQIESLTTLTTIGAGADMRWT
jgi:hypothetical protein